MSRVHSRREPENLTREAGNLTDSIPTGKPGTSGYEGIQINEARSRSGLSSTIEARGCLSVTTRLTESQFDLSSHLQSPNWPKIQKGIEQQLAKIYTNNKLALKHEHWLLKPDRMPDEEGIRSNPLKMLETGQRARSYDGRDPGHLLSSEICSSATREYPSLIQTYFDTHTVDGVFLRDEERLLYARDVLAIPEPRCRHTTDVDESQHEVGSRSGSGGDGDDEPGKDEDAGEDEDVDGDVDS
ncbi:hypothetical protein Tco_0867938 [Tanacetum coccineum]